MATNDEETIFPEALSALNKDVLKNGGLALRFGLLSVCSTFSILSLFVH